MKLAIFIAIIAIISGSLLYVNLQETTQNITDQNNTLSEVEVQQGSQTTQASPSAVIEAEHEGQTKTQEVEIDSPAEAPTNAQSTISNWQYPNATVSQSNPSETTLSTSDSVDSVTDWYKARLETMGAVSRNVVSTKTNGVAQSVITAQANSQSISIIIKQLEVGTEIVVSHNN